MLSLHSIYHSYNLLFSPLFSPLHFYCFSHSRLDFLPPFFVFIYSASLTFLPLKIDFVADITPSISIFPSFSLPLLVSLIQKKAFVIGQYLYQLGPSATWDNSLLSDPGHSKQNHSPALHGSVQSIEIQSSPSATQANLSDRPRYCTYSPAGITQTHKAGARTGAASLLPFCLTHTHTGRQWEIWLTAPTCIMHTGEYSHQACL